MRPSDGRRPALGVGPGTRRGQRAVPAGPRALLAELWSPLDPLLEQLQAQASPRPVHLGHRLPVFNGGGANFELEEFSTQCFKIKLS